MKKIMILLLLLPASLLAQITIESDSGFYCNEEGLYSSLVYRFKIDGIDMNADIELKATKGNIARIHPDSAFFRYRVKTRRITSDTICLIKDGKKIYSKAFQIAPIKWVQVFAGCTITNNKDFDGRLSKEDLIQNPEIRIKASCDDKEFGKILSFDFVTVVGKTAYPVAIRGNRLNEKALEYIRNAKEGQQFSISRIIWEGEAGSKRNLNPIVFIIKASEE